MPLRRIAYHIEFTAGDDSCVLSRLLSLLVFPFAWVLKGKARL